MPTDDDDTAGRRLLDLEDVRRVLDLVSYKPDWDFVVGTLGRGFYLQVDFDAPDCKTGLPAVQRGRKWYVSPYSTPSEVVQTAFLAIRTAEEHELRETFRYQGQAIFGPHFSSDELYKFSLTAHEDARQHTDVGA